VITCTAPALPFLITRVGNGLAILRGLVIGQANFTTPASKPAVMLANLTRLAWARFMSSSMVSAVISEACFTIIFAFLNIAEPSVSPLRLFMYSRGTLSSASNACLPFARAFFLEASVGVCVDCDVQMRQFTIVRGVARSLSSIVLRQPSSTGFSYIRPLKGGSKGLARLRGAISSPAL
jgi:hypothetical protein